MNSFLGRIQRFMAGRNGYDKLCFFVFIIYTILVAANLFIRSPWVAILELLPVGYIAFRILSKNVYKRQQENMAYLRVLSSVKGFFARQKNKFRDIKTHRYISCRHCKAKLRVKRRKGRHTVRCPRCQKEFQVNIRI